jgi:hypothetical protein
MTVLTIFDGPKAQIRDILADGARGLVRWLVLGLGCFLVLLGFLMAPLPGPLGLPVTLAGLILVLRNSFRFRRMFIQMQRRHPRFVFPLRRLLRREPEFMAITWQAILRIEKLLFPKSWRVAKQVRRRYFRFGR